MAVHKNKVFVILIWEGYTFNMDMIENGLLFA